MPANTIRFTRAATVTNISELAVERPMPRFVRNRDLVLNERFRQSLPDFGTPGEVPVDPGEAQGSEQGGGFFSDDIPHLENRDGNIFGFNGEQNGVWYLPGFELLEGVDPAFAFAASQTNEVDVTTGDPFNKCQFSLSLKKTMPADVLAWQAANPTGISREIPFLDMEGAISVQIRDQGELRVTDFRATVTQESPGMFVLRAEGILGVNVIALFQNLRAAGSAKCAFLMHYLAWRQEERPPPPPGSFSTMDLRFERAPIQHTVPIDIGRKYEGGDYQLKYTIASGGVRRIIVGVDDLRDFNVHQSEFSELKVLGDVSLRYPSISKIYFGVVSRTIVVVPARYVILREAGLCAASCNALLDSSPGLSAGCKFQFSFTLMPDVSSIDMLQLINEIASRPEPELKNASVHLPRQFDLGGDLVLATSFLTSSRFLNSATSGNCISLFAEVKEQAGGTPAIANTNMFLSQLRTAKEPFLVGTVKVLLDDVFHTDVISGVCLSFTNTQADGPAGLELHHDNQTGKLTLKNASAADLRVTRVALVKQQSLSIASVNKVLPVSGEVAIDLTGQLEGASLYVDCELIVDKTLSKAELSRYMQFQVVDVQNTQCLISVNAAGVGFASRGIARIDFEIALKESPDTFIASLIVTDTRKTDSSKIIVPIQQALIELEAMVKATVSFTDQTRPPAVIVLENNFGTHPIFNVGDDNVLT
jgi:hypothetical protein